MIKILIADDHAIIRKGLIEIVDDTPDLKVIAEAATGNEALRLIRQQELDVVLLDIAMPGMNGLETLERCKIEKPHLPVLMLSIYPEEHYAGRAFKLGASGYVTKESACHELLIAIRKVAAGGRYISTTLAEKMVDDLGSDHTKPSHHRLSNRELQVMLMIATGKPLRIIADELSLSVKTISTHRTRLLNKLNLSNNAELYRFAHEQRLLD